MSSRLRDLLKRFFGYFSASLLGTAVDTGVLWVCSHLLFCGSYFGRNVLSPIISFECAVFTNFCSCYFFVWKDRITQRSVRSFFTHYATYNASCTGGFLLKLGLLQLVVLLTGLDVVYCNLIALCFSGMFNFLMNDRVIFRNRKKIFDASHYDPGSPAAAPETEQ